MIMIPHILSLFDASLVDSFDLGSRFQDGTLAIFFEDIEAETVHSISVERIFEISRGGRLVTINDFKQASL